MGHHHIFVHRTQKKNMSRSSGVCLASLAHILRDVAFDLLNACEIRLLQCERMCLVFSTTSTFFDAFHKGTYVQR